MARLHEIMKNENPYFYIFEIVRVNGLALLVVRQTRLPFFYLEYKGNRHVSLLFQSIIDEICVSMPGCGQKDVTIVFGEGANSPENIYAIDATDAAQSITACSPYFAEDLIHAGRTQFSAVETIQPGTQGSGRERTVVVIANDEMSVRSLNSIWKLGS